MGNVLCPTYWNYRSPAALTLRIVELQGNIEKLEDLVEKCNRRHIKSVESLRENRSASSLRAAKITQQALSRATRALDVARGTLEHLQHARDGLLTDEMMSRTMGTLKDVTEVGPRRTDSATEDLEKGEEYLQELVGNGEDLVQLEDKAGLDALISEFLQEAVEPQPPVLAAPPPPRTDPGKPKTDPVSSEHAQSVFVGLRQKVVLDA